MSIIQPRIYLASQSPRRRELLKQIGVSFEVLLLRSDPRRVFDVDETPFSDEHPEVYVQRICEDKVQAGWSALLSRNRPPFPVTVGLADQPTIVNNVETFAWAAAILARGAGWFSSIGRVKSSGPKLLSISGDVTRPGVYEFPFGVSIRDLLAAAGGEDARAVIVGGASGTCVPAAQFSRAICRRRHIDDHVANARVGLQELCVDVDALAREYFVDARKHARYVLVDVQQTPAVGMAGQGDFGEVHGRQRAAVVAVAQQLGGDFAADVVLCFERAAADVRGQDHFFV